MIPNQKLIPVSKCPCIQLTATVYSTGLLKGPPYRTIRSLEYGRATVRLIGERHRELSYPVFLIYQIDAVAKPSSYQVYSRMAWL